MDNIKEEKIETETVDETELDKALEESIESVKAGNELTPPVKEGEEAKEEEKPEETPVETPPEEASEPPKEGEEKPEEYDFRVPNKGKFESDESYEKRIELLDLVKRKKLAKTEEQRQSLSEDIKTAKSQMKTINGTDRIVNQFKKVDDEPEKPTEELTEEQKALEADKERLKQLGGATKEDIEQIIQQERLATDVKNTLEKFVDRHYELKDEDIREVFFDFVDSNYNWKGKGGKELMTVLELARENMFKPSESMQERVLKGANVQEKVNAMQFPGGTVARADFSPEIRQSIDELVATGMSEEKAIEILSD